MSLSQLTCTNLQSPEGVVLDTSDLVASKVKDPKVLQTPKHVGSDQADEVAIESKLQQLCLVEKCPRLQGWDAVVLEVQVMEATQTSQVLKTDLHYSIVLEEDGLLGREGELN